MAKMRVAVVVGGLLAVTGVACLIAGIVLLHNKSSSASSCNSETASTTCSYSEEAKRVQLPEFLQKVQDTFYDLHPERITRKPKVSREEILEKFRSYDPSPEHLQRTTDKSFELLAEIRQKKIIKRKLKPRERKALAQVIHYLQHVFGTPYDGNYYNGDYLLGPNMFCWQPICNVNQYWVLAVNYSKPTTAGEVQRVLNMVKTLNHTFLQYRQNLIYGVQAGMVRSTEDCKAGLQTFLRGFSRLSQPKDIFNHSMTKRLLSDQFLSSLSKQEKDKWLEENKKTVKDDMRDHVLEYIGKPLHQLITYLKTTYIEHCVPWNISSGLSGLPLTHVYINGSKTNQSTDPFLPTGQALNGSKAYKNIMSYFTTSDITVNEVHDLGHKMIKELYPQVLELARNETQMSNDTDAKSKFYLKLNDSAMYYLKETIPEIESNATAYTRCNDTKNAQKFCPVRWKAIQRWFKDAYKIMSVLDSKTVKMFYFTGVKHTTPNCPVKVVPNFNPAMGVASYRPSTPNCDGTASYFIPFFLSRPGPKFTQWSVNAHEARPGHHTQVQGLAEHFRDWCGGVIGWLGSSTGYTAFIEGWGLYAENPLIAVDTDMYDNEPMYKYGMLRSQLWRAIRLVVDTGLHFKGFSRQQSLQYFEKYVWETSDVVQKEVTRYQSNPGQATAYMVGQLHLVKLREHAQKELGKAFVLKDFHYHLLKHGSAPLSYISESINEYIRCTKNNTDVGCEYVLATREGSGKPKGSDYITYFNDDVIQSYY